MKGKVTEWAEGCGCDWRTCRGFLLFPKCIGGEWRWLEWVLWVQRKTWVGFPICDSYIDNVRWVY